MSLCRYKPSPVRLSFTMVLFQRPYSGLFPRDMSICDPDPPLRAGLRTYPGSSLVKMQQPREWIGSRNIGSSATCRCLLRTWNISGTTVHVWNPVRLAGRSEAPWVEAWGLLTAVTTRAFPHEGWAAHGRRDATLYNGVHISRSCTP